MNDLLNSQLLTWLNPDVILRGIIVYVFVVWFCLVVWVVRDVTNRTKSVIFQVLSIVLVLFFTPLGIFIYLLIRPQKTLFEKVFEDEFFKMDAEYQKEHAEEVKKLKEPKKEVKEMPVRRRYVPGMDITNK